MESSFFRSYYISFLTCFYVRVRVEEMLYPRGHEKGAATTEAWVGVYAVIIKLCTEGVKVQRTLNAAG